MLKRLFPWKYLLRLAARRFDIIDPLSVAARIRSFAQPSEVQEPIELLRAGIIFHARGLINTKAIQHNLDWIWPYWVERQFNPQDPSFIPRAFSFSHINLTHRNWTAVGQPDLPIYPIVDPRGLVTPLADGWSIDCWWLAEDGTALYPSKEDNVTQTLRDDTARTVVTCSTSDRVQLVTEVAMEVNDSQPTLRLQARVESDSSGWLIFTLRPYNPEGVQFIENVRLLEERNGFRVNDTTDVLLAQKPEKYLFADYRQGDVFQHLRKRQRETEQSCRIGMVTAAACHRVSATATEEASSLHVPLPPAENFPDRVSSRSWVEVEQKAARLQIPDSRLSNLYTAASRTLIHLSAGDVIPGPYTYNRFWFRDACIMLNVLLALGLEDRSRRHLDTFADRQTREGFFHSQDGEWDANGQVLWLFNRYRLLAGGKFNPEWIPSIIKGARWIDKKRVLSTEDPKIRGLLPSGFSAEHFGPNDNYYWDDFWAIAGLHGAADSLAAQKRTNEEKTIRQTATDMAGDLFRSIALVAEETGRQAIPTSPNRRMDSGAIGSLVADYPLQLFGPGDERMLATCEYLLANCLQQGCFFQDMIHSGINIYMTLELAQVLLRAADPRFKDLLLAAASLASPTGQWPEAIHPLTGGGCMGDGQHGWAAAEYLMLIRNMFILDEKSSLVIGQGILPEWLKRQTTLSYGPTLTPFGRLKVTIDVSSSRFRVRLHGHWYENHPETITVRLPGYEEKQLEGPDYTCTVTRAI